MKSVSHEDFSFLFLLMVEMAFGRVFSFILLYVPNIILKDTVLQNVVISPWFWSYIECGLVRIFGIIAL
jgi:hypothetical protein